MVGKIKQNLGPMWWSVALIFIAQRLGDIVNIVIGLWLVPKYVPEAELGAVLALAQVGGVLGLPLAILMIPFEKFLNVFAVGGELGKVKRLLRDGFLLIVVFGVLIYAGAKFLMPHVFERMRVQDGMLTRLIVFSGVLATFSPLFLVALQALKKFKELSLLSLLTAPVRLVAMLIMLPIRGLSGYFAGQVCTDGFTIAFVLVSLRRVVGRKIESVPYWSQWREIIRYTWPVVFLLVAGRIQTATEYFVIRHRLPDVESAAYYFITRFAELPMCLWTATRMVFFPLVSEQSDLGLKTGRLFGQSMCLILVGGGLIVTVFYLLFPFMLAYVPIWQPYLSFAPLMGVIGGTCVVRTAFACFVAYELACRRFGFVVYTTAIYLAEAVFLYGSAGIGFFEGMLPPDLIRRIQAYGLVDLSSFSWAILLFSFVLLIVALCHNHWEEKRARSRAATSYGG